jgi:hypothetical protein
LGAGMSFFADGMKAGIGMIGGDLLGMNASAFRASVRAELAATFAEPLEGRPGAAAELTAAAHNLGATLIASSSDSNVVAFVDGALNMSVLRSDLTLLLDEAVDYYSDSRSQSLDVPTLARVFDVSPAVMHIFLRPERACRRVPALKGKEFLLKLLHGEALAEMVAENPDRMAASLRGFFAEAGVHPSRFPELRERLADYGRKGGAVARKEKRAGGRKRSSLVPTPPPPGGVAAGVASFFVDKAKAAAAFHPVLACVVITGSFGPDAIAFELLRLALVKDLAAVLSLALPTLVAVSPVVADDGASVFVSFTTAAEARFTEESLSARLDGLSMEAFAELRTCYAWGVAEKAALGLSSVSVLMNELPAAATVRRPRLRKLNGFFLQAMESRAEGFHDDFVRVLCHLSNVTEAEAAAQAAVAPDADADSDADTPVEQAPAEQAPAAAAFPPPGAPRKTLALPLLIGKTPLDESSVACFGGEEDEAAEACYHLQPLRIMMMTVGTQLKRKHAEQSKYDALSPAQQAQQRRLLALQYEQASKDAAAAAQNAQDAGVAYDGDEDIDLDDGCGAEDDDNEALDAPIFVAAKEGRVDVKHRTTRRVMALLRAVAPLFHAHVLRQLREARLEHRRWLTAATQHLSVKLRCVALLLEDIVVKRHSIATYVFHDVDEVMDTFSEVTDAVFARVGRAAQAPSAPAEQLPGHAYVSPDSASDSSPRSASVSPTKRAPTRSLRALAGRLKDMVVPRLTSDELVDFAFQAASPFTLIDVDYEIPRPYRNLFGVLYGVVDWYPMDVARAFSALATITVRGRGTPLAVIGCIASKFPIKVRHVVTGLATLAAGVPHPSLLAVADHLTIPFNTALRIRELLLPLETPTVWRGGELVVPAGPNWLVFLRAVAQGNIFALLRYKEYLDTDVTAFAMIHANTHRIKKTLSSVFASNQKMKDLLAAGLAVDKKLDPAGEGAAGAFPALLALTRRHATTMAPAAEEEQMRLVTGTFLMMRSKFDEALKEFEAFCGVADDIDTRRKLLTARIGVLVARLVVEDGAVNDPDAVIGVIIDLLRELPEFLKSKAEHRHQRPKNLDAVIGVVAPFAAKYLPMLLNRPDGDDVDDFLRRNAGGFATATGDADHMGQLIHDMGDALKVVVRCLAPGPKVAVDASPPRQVDFDSPGLDAPDAAFDVDDPTEADNVIDITVAALIALRSDPTLPDVIDNVIAMISGRHVGSEDELKDLSSSMRQMSMSGHGKAPAPAAMTDDIVDNARQMNEQIRLLSREGQGPKFFMGLLSFIIERAQQPQPDAPVVQLTPVKEMSPRRRVAASTSVSPGAAAQTAVAVVDAEELLSDDHDKIQLVVAFADGDMSVLAELLKAAGVQPQPQCLQQFRKVLGMMNSLKRMNRPGNASSFSTTDMLDIVTSEIFKELDTGNTGLLSYDDFLTALDRMHIDVTDHQARIWFQDIDTDKSGAINEGEFQRAIQGILKYLQNQMLDELRLSQTTIYISLAWTALIMLCLLTFLIMGVIGFTDGTSFSAVITGAIPMLGSAVGTVPDPNQMKMLLTKIDTAATVFFEKVIEAKKAARKAA